MTSQAAPAAAPAVTFLGPVETTKIAVGKQIRTKFDKAYITELAESIRARGTLINPVTLRKDAKPGQFVLVSGECRLRAYRELGWTKIPATLVELDADEARLWQIDENLKRRNLTALEEARGFKELLDAGRRTAEELASLVKKDVGYVTRTVRLLELPKEVVADLELEKITPAHGHQMLRVLPKDRLEVYNDWLANYGDNGNARSLREHVDQTVGRSLEGAAFPLNKPYAGQIACSACPSNSGNQGDMFGGAMKGRCLGPKTCFSDKVAQSHEDKLTELRKGWPSASGVASVSGHIYSSTKVDFGDQRGWVAREVFNKRVPKGKWALVLCKPTGEVWLCTPATTQEQKVEAQVNAPVAQAPKLSPEEVAAAQEREAKRDAAITAAVLKATPKQIASAFEKRFASWELDILKQAKVKPSDTLRALWVVGVRNGDWSADELVKLLGVKVPK